MRGSALQEFEQRLNKLFDQIDEELEERWGGAYPLHPSRSERGETGNPEFDGLFNIGASFSAGYGSEHGKGYVIEVRMVTLTRVDPEQREQIQQEAADRVDALLPVYFPGRALEVVRDGNLYKITGDFSLS